jgi:phospholipid/cholesterol/gamma-HCH transport system permease protein
MVRADDEVSFQVSGDGLRVVFPERMTVLTASSLLEQVRQGMGDRSVGSVIADVGRVSEFDDFGALALLELKRRSQEMRAAFNLENEPRAVSQVLDLIGFQRLDEGFCSVPRSRPSNIFVRLGEAICKILGDCTQLMTFTGEVLICLVRLVPHPRRLRGNDLLSSMNHVGVDALPIVALISFLMGLIIAFMSSVQLEQFGANIYVASLVSMAMVKELGPMITGILVAGRSGSSFAAEIGSMKISREVDALTTMGFDPTLFAAIPKILASIVVLPLLVMFADIAAITGGLLVGVGMLDLTVKGFLHQAIDSLTLFDFTWSLFKSAVFGLLISMIGCFRGFMTEGGSVELGRETTSAVVSGIFLIILTDSVLVVLLQYWG